MYTENTSVFYVEMNLVELEMAATVTIGKVAQQFEANYFYTTNLLN